jgi:hypothetical protein
MARCLGGQAYFERREPALPMDTPTIIESRSVIHPSSGRHCGMGVSFLGLSATHRLSGDSPAIEAAPGNAVRTTFVVRYSTPLELDLGPRPLAEEHSVADFDVNGDEIGRVGTVVVEVLDADVAEAVDLAAHGG